MTTLTQGRPGRTRAVVCVFLKPDTANQSRGAMALEWNEAGGLRLCGRSLDRQPVDVSGHDAIAVVLAEAFARQDYPAQQMLCNSAEFSRFCMTPELVTVRLVAARIGRGIEPIYMMLEAPADTDLWQVNPIDHDGRVRLRPDTTRRSSRPAYCTGCEHAPCWEDMLDLARRAHERRTSRRWPGIWP